MRVKCRQLRAGTERAVRAICKLDPERVGNSAHHHRYSFGRACKSGFERDADWAVMIDPPAVSAVLTELWGEYCCNGVGGDFSLPGAVDKQRLHSDIADAFKYLLPKHSLDPVTFPIHRLTSIWRSRYEVIDTPEARALRPRHWGSNNSNLQHGRGKYFAKLVAYDAPEKEGVEYLRRHDFFDPTGETTARDGPSGYLNVVRA